MECSGTVTCGFGRTREDPTMRHMTPPVIRSRRGTAGRALTLTVAAALLASACSDDGNDKVATTETPAGTQAPAATTAPEDPVAGAQQRVTDAEDGVTQAQAGLTSAHGTFCDSTTT